MGELLARALGRAPLALARDVGKDAGRDLHAAPLGELLHRLDEAEAVDLLHEGDEVAARLARELVPEATARYTFSLLYGVLALDTGEFRFVSAGHPGPVHLTDGRLPNKLEVTGFPVGVGGAEYKEQAVVLKPADRLILYSDRLTGVRNAEGEHFGTCRLLAALDETRRLPVADSLAGLVRAVDAEAGELIVDFDGRKVAYDFGELDELVLAYATTVHKSQGSEYPAVVLPLTTQHYPMLQRNLLYTGVTRGKRLVVLVAQPKAVAMAVKGQQERRRWSKLKEWLEVLAGTGPSGPCPLG